MLLLSILVVGCEDQRDSQSATVREKDSVVVPKHKHQKLDEPAICAELSVSECLRIIIPAIWDREIERDCS